MCTGSPVRVAVTVTAGAVEQTIRGATLLAHGTQGRIVGVSAIDRSGAQELGAMSLALAKPGGPLLAEWPYDPQAAGHRYPVAVPFDFDTDLYLTSPVDEVFGHTGALQLFLWVVTDGPCGQ